MSENPVNLALRFLLELAALAALGQWGWVAHDGAARWVWTVGLVVVAHQAISYDRIARFLQGGEQGGVI